MTDFFICSIKSPKLLISIAKNYFDSDFDVPKASNFTSSGGTKLQDKRQETGSYCDVISGLQAWWKTGFSDIFLFSYKQRTIVPFLSELISSQKENDWELCFSWSLKSWKDVTVIASVLFLVSRFCTPPKVKFDAFGTSKHGEGKLLSKIFSLLYISVHWGHLIEQIKKNLS